jgi:hypothetical protein
MRKDGYREKLGRERMDSPAGSAQCLLEHSGVTVDQVLQHDSAYKLSPLLIARPGTMCEILFGEE